MSVSVAGKKQVKSSSRILKALASQEEAPTSESNQRPEYGEAVVTMDRASGEGNREIQRQNLHGAKFEGESVPWGDPSPAEPSTVTPSGDNSDNSGSSGNPVDRKIAELLDRIGQGFQADDATNFEKLTIARQYGPLLWDLKALASHGEFMDKLRERFPKVNYAKCNRWMFIAKHETEVAAAIEKYPDVAWGPKKMIDFLKEFWMPDEEGEDEEDDCFGNVREDHVEAEPLVSNEAETVDAPEPDENSPYAVGAFNPELKAAAEANQQEQHEGSQEVSPGATAGPVTQAVRTTPRNEKGKSRIRPAVNRTEFDVEVRVGFKLSVPENVTAEQVSAALREARRWTVGINTPFEFELSEMGVVVGHVQPWSGTAEVAQQ